MKGNRSYGKMLAETVLKSFDGPNFKPPRRPESWLTSWTNPVQSRDRYRRWLSMWLKGALEDIPPEIAARYLEELSEDIRHLDHAQAVDRFINKVLPEVLLNEPKDEKSH